MLTKRYMKDQIVLTEYDYIFEGSKDEGGNRAIDKKSFEELESFVLKNLDVVSFLKIGQDKNHKFIKAQNYVGVIQTRSGTTIEILPKISDADENIENSRKTLLKMLKTLKKSPFKNFNMAHLKSTKLPLFEIFIEMFLEELSILIQRGIKNDYITQKENQKFLKGKLLIKNQIKYNSIHKERFFVEYQDYLSDRVENRLIKTTLKLLYKKSKSNRNRQRIREFLFVFDEVSFSKDIKRDFSKVNLDRQMRYYEQTLLWCKTFLLENSFSPYKGKDVAFALLFDMNQLFESYVGVYLKNRCKNVSLQDMGKHLVDEPKKFALRPDIVIRSKNKTIIADTKWKKIENEKDISQNDMYQLYAYAKKYKSKRVYLIYPKYRKDQPKLKYSFCKDDEVFLRVLYFDLEKDLIKV